MNCLKCLSYLGSCPQTEPEKRYWESLEPFHFCQAAKVFYTIKDKPWQRQTLTKTNSDKDEPWQRQTLTKTNPDKDKPWQRQTLTKTNPNKDKPWQRQTLTKTNLDKVKLDKDKTLASEWLRLNRQSTRPTKLLDFAPETTLYHNIEYDFLQTIHMVVLYISWLGWECLWIVSWRGDI